MLDWLNVSITSEVVTHDPAVDDSLDGVSSLPSAAGDYAVETETFEVQGLLTGDGIRFMFTSFVPNFLGFTAVGVILVAMIGVGVAELSGLVGGADPQARRDLDAGDADLHHRVRRDRLEHRRRRRLPRADPAGGDRVPERRAQPAGRHRRRLRGRRARPSA